MNRRTFLAGVTAASGTLVAGCHTASGEDPEYASYYTLYNHADVEHSVALRIADGDGNRLLDETFWMEPRSAREHVTLDGEPARARVRVDDRDPEEFEWPATRQCREENKAGRPGLRVKILSRADRERDEVRYEWPCESVSPSTDSA